MSHWVMILSSDDGERVEVVGPFGSRLDAMSEYCDHYSAPYGQGWSVFITAVAQPIMFGGDKIDDGIVTVV